jgi:hypothetical protein
MWDFNLGRAIGMVLRTLPFVLLRMAVFFGIGFAYLLTIGRFRELAGKAANWIPKPSPPDAANPAAAPRAV